MEALNNFLTTYGFLLQLLGLLVQLVYWLALTVASLWAVLLFKRLVDFKTGTGPLSAGEDAGEGDKDVSVDSFVD